MYQHAAPEPFRIIFSTSQKEKQRKEVHSWLSIPILSFLPGPFKEKNPQESFLNKSSNLCFSRSIPSPTPAAAAPWATCLRCPARPRPRHVGMAPPHGAWAPSGPSQRHHRDWRVWHLLVWRLGGKGEGRRLCVVSWLLFSIFFEGLGGDNYLKVRKGSWTWSMFF